MTVTNILEYDKKRVLVELDEHLTFPLYNSEVRKYNIVKDEEVSEQIYEEIIEQILSKRIKMRAMKLLEKRSYTRATLKRKLLEGKYPSFLVETALDYVSKFHYIDDLKFAEDYINCHASKRSKVRIFQDLFAKGIARGTVEEAWEQYVNQNETVDESEQIMKILSKKHFDKNTVNYKEKARIYQFLCRKGYDSNCIRKCMQFNEEYTD